MTKDTCAVSGCGRARRARGWCATHYDRARDHGDPVAGAPIRRYGSSDCSIGDCDRPAVARGWCAKHYHRWLRHGSPDVTRTAPKMACSLDGCERPCAARKPLALCAAHRAQLLRGAALGPLRKKNANGLGWVDADKYQWAYLDGVRTLVHRRVMEEMIGRPLMRHENVHHRNGVRSDNRPENLELWAVPQPSGQRPEDLAAWVVAEYRDLVVAALRALG